MEVGFSGMLKEAALAFVEANKLSSNQGGDPKTPKTSNPDHSSQTLFLTENGNFGCGLSKAMPSWPRPAGNMLLDAFLLFAVELAWIVLRADTVW
jgi:hypothetical protein